MFGLCEIELIIGVYRRMYPFPTLRRLSASDDLIRWMKLTMNTFWKRLQLMLLQAMLSVEKLYSFTEIKFLYIANHV